MNNPIRRHCRRRHIEPLDLAYALDVSPFELLEAIYDDGHRALKNRIADYLGFTCWSDLLFDNQLTLARQKASFLMYVPASPRIGRSDDGIQLVQRYRNINKTGRDETVLLWKHDRCWYVEQKSCRQVKERIQRFQEKEAQALYEKKVKEIQA